MAGLLSSISRRSLLRLFFAVPFLQMLEKYLSPFFGGSTEASAASAPFKAAKLSELKEPWSSASFTYKVKVKGMDAYKKEVAGEESVPGLVIRLPQELAGKIEGAKEGLYVVDMHCTHERCVTAYLTDQKEIKAVSNLDAKNPVAFCPCHQSVFDLGQGGKAVKGPAKSPLWKFSFEVKGGDVVITGLDPKGSTWEPGRPGGLMSEYPVRKGEEGL